jgi:hypothetical protein
MRRRRGARACWGGGEKALSAVGKSLSVYLN